MHFVPLPIAACIRRIRFSATTSSPPRKIAFSLCRCTIEAFTVSSAAGNGRTVEEEQRQHKRERGTNHFCCIRKFSCDRRNKLKKECSAFRGSQKLNVPTPSSVSRSRRRTSANGPFGRRVRRQHCRTRGKVFHRRNFESVAPVALSKRGGTVSERRRNGSRRWRLYVENPSYEDCSRNDILFEEKKLLVQSKISQRQSSRSPRENE